jgi:hypothetical protein
MTINAQIGARENPGGDLAPGKVVRELSRATPARSDGIHQSGQ